MELVLNSIGGNDDVGILYSIANRAVFLRPWREVHFRSSIIAEALDVLLYRYMTKHAA